MTHLNVEKLMSGVGKDKCVFSPDLFSGLLIISVMSFMSCTQFNPCPRKPDNIYYQGEGTFDESIQKCKGSS